MVEIEFKGLTKLNEKLYRDAIQHFVLQTVGFRKFRDFDKYLVTLEIVGGPDDNPETYTDLVNGMATNSNIPHGVTIPGHSTVFIDDIDGVFAFEQNMIPICHELCHGILNKYFGNSPYTGPSFQYYNTTIKGGEIWVNGVHSRINKLMKVYSLNFYFVGISYVQFFGIDIRDELS